MEIDSGISTAPRSNEQRAVDNFNAISNSPRQHVLNTSSQPIICRYLGIVIETARMINQATDEARYAVRYLENVVRLQLERR